MADCTVSNKDDTFHFGIYLLVLTHQVSLESSTVIWIVLIIILIPPIIDIHVLGRYKNYPFTPPLHRLNNSLCEVKIWCSSTVPQKTLRILDFCLTSREWYFPELCWIRKRKTKGLQAGGGIFWCYAERDVIPRDDLFCLAVCRQVSRRLKKIQRTLCSHKNTFCPVSGRRMCLLEPPKQILLCADKTSSVECFSGKRNHLQIFCSSVSDLH